MAHVIPILKKGKNKLLPNSYRPISLLSCVGKLLERIINKRQLWYLSSTQTGNRKHRSTEDQLSLHAQEVENGFQDKKKTIAVFFDLTQAFDRVWKDGLLLKLLQKGIRCRIFSWIKNLLVHKSARVMVDGKLSHRAHHREGVPQGGVVSPPLFLVFIDDITDCVPRHVSNTLHADDFAVWSTTIHTNTAVKRIKGTVDNVNQWTKDWGQEASKTKTCSTKSRSNAMRPFQEADRLSTPKASSSGRGSSTGEVTCSAWWRTNRPWERPTSSQGSKPRPDEGSILSG
jgi:hypothetical protein